MLYRSQTFQRRTIGWRLTLPAAILITAAGWLLGALLLPGQGTSPSAYSLWHNLGVGAVPLWLHRTVSAVLCALIGYFLVVLNNEFAIIRMRASVQTSLFFLFTAACPMLHTLSAGNWAAALLLASLFFLFASYQHPAPMGHLFHAFAFLGMGSLVLPQLTLFAPVFWMGAYMMQSLTVRSFFASLVGWALPYWLLFAYAYTTGQMELFFAPLRELAALRPLAPAFQPAEWATLAYLFVLFAAGAGHSLVAGYDDKIRTRASLHFLILLATFTFIYMLLQPALMAALLHVLLIPCSVLGGHLFVLTGSRAANVFFIVSLLGLVVIFMLNLWMLL